MSEAEREVRRAILAAACAFLLTAPGSPARPLLHERMEALCRRAGNLADGDLAPVVMAASRMTGVVPSPGPWWGEDQLRAVVGRYFAGQSDVLAAVVERVTGARCA